VPLARAVLVAAISLASVPVSAAPRDTSPEALQRLAELAAEVDAHVHALRYAEARTAAEAALALGAADRPTVARLARVLAEIAAALDDPKGAERWFLLWIKLHGNLATLPPGSSPKLTAPYEAARARTAQRHSPFEPQLVVEPTADPERWRVRLWVERDPDGFVGGFGVTVIVPGGDQPIFAGESVEFPPGASVVTREYAAPRRPSVTAAVRDRHGNELECCDLHDYQAPTSVRAPRVSWYRRPWPYGVAAGVVAGLGGVFVWRRSVATDDLDHILANSSEYTFADAEDARGRAERHGWSAVASFAAAGALLATTVILAVRAPDERAVTLAPTSGGAMVLATTPF
jgi:hypothetical protein